MTLELEPETRAVIDGADRSTDELKTLAGALRDGGRSTLAEEMLIAVARRALHDAWRPGERARFAGVLRDHQQFGYARRLLTRVRASSGDSELLRQQHALCTYKDLELPARRRLEHALAILEEGGDLEQSVVAETLGIAGAICKRLWDVDAKRADLEQALRHYRRGFSLEGDAERWYAGVNAAFVSDQLAAQEEDGSDAANAWRADAQRIRETIVAELTGGDGGWNDATLGEAYFGLGRFAEAKLALSAVGANTKELWRQETSAMQLAVLARLHRAADDPDAVEALQALVGGRDGAVRRAAIGKVGIALSGGGYRSALYHLGVLARLAEARVLRHVEVLSCVSGGSIVGAYYYLALRELLERKSDAEITDDDYVELAQRVVDGFLKSVTKNLRGRLFTNIGDNARMLVTRYSRTDRVSDLLEQHFYGELRMPEITVAPEGTGDGFSLRYENWQRRAKVPILVLNATTLNTGHNWQFTATWMGEPPSTSDERVDASRRLRRVYYRDAPSGEDALERPRLSTAVAASACVPGLFAPIRIERLYDGVDVELVDGGVHDNQGIASLVEQDCAVILVSDASGQLRDAEDPKRWFGLVLKRSNDVLMKRVRGSQFAELEGRVRAGTLRALMIVHLTKGLAAPPRDWSKCEEPWTPEDDAMPTEAASPYGIDPQVQLALAKLRTDLDSFTDDEAYALMAAGYRMTEVDLPDALKGSEPPLSAGWPFDPALREMQHTDATRLTSSLRPGADLLLRKPKSWLRRLRVRR